MIIIIITFIIIIGSKLVAAAVEVSLTITVIAHSAS